MNDEKDLDQQIRDAKCDLFQSAYKWRMAYWDYWNQWAFQAIYCKNERAGVSLNQHLPKLREDLDKYDPKYKEIASAYVDAYDRFYELMQKRYPEITISVAHKG